MSNVTVDLSGPRQRDGVALDRANDGAVDLYGVSVNWTTNLSAFANGGRSARDFAFHGAFDLKIPRGMQDHDLSSVELTLTLAVLDNMTVLPSIGPMMVPWICMVSA